MIGLIDIDHTLSNATWRDPMLGVASWDEYHMEATSDEPIPEMVELVRALHKGGWQLFGLTARPEKFHFITMNWLVNHDIPLMGLLMRPNDNFLPSPEIKVKVFQHYFNKVEPNSIVVFDDRDDVVAAFKAIGITSLQVNAARSPRTKEVDYADNTN